MRDDRTHPLLAQVSLSVSPFVTLPTAATLPYTYKTMPSTLPAPSTGIMGGSSSSNSGNGSEKPKYVVAQSGHAAHPDDIVTACRALREHIERMQEDANRELRALEDRIRERELAEKRRVAPGWLDSEARLLEPERRPGEVDAASAETTETVALANQLGGMTIAGGREGVSEMAVDQGEELDRAFGGMK